MVNRISGKTTLLSQFARIMSHTKDTMNGHEDEGPETLLEECRITISDHSVSFFLDTRYQGGYTLLSFFKRGNQDKVPRYCPEK